jgi:hypothetical protein
VVIAVRNLSIRRTAGGFERRPYSTDEVDAIAAYCPDNGECYYVPLALMRARTQFQLRLEPPANGQIASVHYARDYRLGAVAQLEERRAGSAKVRGSSPLSSIGTPAGS